MYPVYRGMNSYPYQRTPMPSTQYYHPTWEAAPPQSTDNPARHPFMHEPWPQSYGYPSAIPCHGCCNHAQYPHHYDIRPPHPHYPPPPAAFYGASYPYHYPPTYVPPPHYNMDMPRYDYDKVFPKEHHCCGCPNHSCHVNEPSKNVKIVEEEPEAAAGTKESNSLVPANYPYPIFYLPPEYTTMNKEQPRVVVETEADKKQTSPLGDNKLKKEHPRRVDCSQPNQQRVSRKPQKAVEQEPNARYQWFPLDMDRIKKLIEGGDVREGQGQMVGSGDGKKSNDQEKENEQKYSYPIIWFPYGSRAEDHGKKQEQGQENAEKSPTIKFGPVKGEHDGNEGQKQKTAVGDHGSEVESQSSKRESKVRTIPVKQLDESVQGLSKKDEEKKENGKPAQSIETNREHESAKDKSTMQSSSSPKKSKLPPICLRVDPPKKKNGKGSSRSPSPPGDNRRMNTDESKEVAKSTGLHPCRKEVKVAEATDRAPTQNKIEVSQSSSGGNKRPVAEMGRRIVQENAGVEPAKAKNEVNKGLQAEDASGANRSTAQEPSKLQMSETEAAVVIQAAYRGYDVRRWESLKKLRQIAKVQDEANELKMHIEEFQSRPSVDSKEKVAISETIMNLLLKLDTIQGLHRSIRDVRRAAAKELIILQEKLDSLGSQKPDDTVQESSAVNTDSALSEVSDSVVETSEVVPDISLKGESAEDGEKNAIFRRENEVTSSNAHVPSQPFCSQEVRSGYESGETTDVIPQNVEASNEPRDEALLSASEVPDTVDSLSDEKGLEQRVEEAVLENSSTESQESSDDLGTEDNLPVEVDTKSEANDEETNQIAELPIELVNDEEKHILGLECVQGMVSADNDEGLAVLAELPQENIKEEDVARTSENLSHETSLAEEADQFNEKTETTGQELLAESQTGDSTEFSEGDVGVNTQVMEQEHEQQELPVEDDALAAGIGAGKLIEFLEKENDNEELTQGAIENVAGPEEKSKEEIEVAHQLQTAPVHDNITESSVEPVATMSEACEELEHREDDTATTKQSTEGQESATESESEEEIDNKVIEENARLKEMLQKLVASEKEQQDIISNLSTKLEDLENKLAKKKKARSTKRPSLIMRRRRQSRKPSKGSS